MARKKNLSRREFLQTSAAAATGIAAASVARAGASFRDPPAVITPPGGFDVAIIHDTDDSIVRSVPVLQWALNPLSQALNRHGIAVRPKASAPVAGELSIIVAGVNSPRARQFLAKAGVKPPDSAESLTLVPGSDKTILVTGTDPRSLVYGLTELADRLQNAPNKAAALAALNLAKPIAEKPASPIRGIFRMFVSETEDKRWFYDRVTWTRYLDMLVTHRFNRFNLSFGLSYDFSRGLTDVYTFFAYPFFVSVPGYNVRAVNRAGTAIPADEQAKNLDTLKFISDQCALRALDFNLGIWTHSYTWTNSPNATHTIQGLNAQTQAPYSRDALNMMLKALPGVTGVTLRTHGESGVPEGSYDLWKIIMSGIAGLKNPDGTPRIIELDLHAKTMTQEMIDTAFTTQMPITISCKFWAEHMGLPYVQSSIRQAEMPKASDGAGLMALSSGTRSFLRYGIGDLLSKDRKYKVIHRVWPGTQRLLLWGDPLYAAEMGRAAHFAGMDGIEYFEPLSFKGRAGSSMNIPAAPDRSGYADASLRVPLEQGGDIFKYAYTFRLLGRLSYNPDADPESWQRYLKSEFVDLAGDVETALASASRILPLITTAHDPAAANAQYWPEIYVNQSLHSTANPPYSEAPNPKIFSNVTSLDPQMFSSISEYVDSLLANKPLAKISPIQVANQIETWAIDAFISVIGATPVGGQVIPNPAAHRRLIADVRITAYIGDFFVRKIRAAALYTLFDRTAYEPARAAAVANYKDARDSWANLINFAKIYVDDLSFGADRQLRRHWKDRLPDIDADIASLTTLAAPRRANTFDPKTLDALITQIPSRPDEPTTVPPIISHTPPATFKPGTEVRLFLGNVGGTGATLFYRHLHQGEKYSSLPLTKDDAGLAATISADFTNSKFPLQYYFELTTGNTATLCPGFKQNFTGTPYFIINIS